MLPHRERRNPESRSSLKWKKMLGAGPDLPAELVHFIAEGAPTSTKGPQHSLDPAGGAWPKILATASCSPSHLWSWTRTGRERLDPVRYPWWITDKSSQSNNPYPQWWRDLSMSRKLSTGMCVIQGEHNKHTTQHYALWQMTAFRLHWHSRRSLARGMSHLPYKGFAHRTFTSLPMTNGVSGSSIKKKHWL